MTDTYHFNAQYAEEATLRDGTRVQLRLVRPSDKDMLRRGFARLSPASRYRRFLSAKNSLSLSELRYLTELDGVDHLAIGAVLQPSAGEPEGLGIARFVRLENDPSVAEPAVVVLDDAQGKGLGRLLLQRLVAAASERGIKRFRCEVLVPNEPVRALLRELVPDASIASDGEIMHIEIPLPDPPSYEALDASSRQTSFYQLFVLAAKKAISVARPIGPKPPRRSSSPKGPA